jgi:hypothetical protein
VNEAARELGLPPETLRGWASGRHISAEVAREFGVVKEALSARIEEVIFDMIDSMPEKIEAASLKDVGATVAQLIDKMRLLNEQPPQITESLNRSEILVRLIERTMEEFPGTTREQVIHVIRDVKPEAIKFLS